MCDMQAVVRQDESGKLVLDDPMAAVIGVAVAKHNCRVTFEAQGERVRDFVRRVQELGRSPMDVVIVLANVDTPAGRVLADALMPGHNWQQFRDAGQVPFARGLAGRAGIESFVQKVDAYAGDELRDHEGLAVVVVDHGVVAVFSAEDI